MIRNLGSFYWEVSSGRHVQRVVGTLADARKTERSLFAKRSANVQEARTKQIEARYRVREAAA